MQDSMLLSKISSPKDLKNLSYDELKYLAQEIRTEILETTAKTGGHLSSNLGVVELTIALHRVFDTPADAIVWDVGHQSYTHKLLTGRVESFSTIRQKDGISGFPKISESEYDSFGAGHASTSISAAVGLLAANELQRKHARVIAVIGDGALTGGLAFEGIENACACTKNLIIVLNDNGFSISKNNSSFSKYLSKMTIGKGYQQFKFLFDSAVLKVPVLGERFLNFIRKVKSAIKSMSFSTNFFVDFGFEYVGPINGHNIRELESVFNTVKNLHRPVVVHIKTKKGYGYSYAEHDPERFHGVGHFDVADGKLEASGGTTFSSVFSKTLCNLAETNPRITAITAAMLGGTGLEAFHKLFPRRCFDVGIAEAHAVTFAAGLAKNGMKPCVALYSTFLQRACDQIIHDVALQNLPIVFAIDRAGAVPHDGETHQGAFDVSILRCIPNMTILSPATAAEMESFFSWGFEQQSPVAIRYPKAVCPNETGAFTAPVVRGRGIFLQKTGADVLLVLCSGGLYPEIKTARDLLQDERIFADIYHLRFIKPINTDYFLEVAAPYRAIVFIEDGAKIGGVASELERTVLKAFSTKRTAVLAFGDAFLKQGSRSEVLETAGLSAPHIAQTTKELLAQLR